MLSQGARLTVIEAADPALRDGFHDFEPLECIRWTDGDAALPRAALDGFDGRLTVEVRLGGATRYPLLATALAA
jgi:hypothetical protein